MIKANELRIGNYVHKIDASIAMGGAVTYMNRLHVIDHSDIYSIVEACDPTNHPIPLTPEWLERMGFEFLDSIINGKYYVEWINSPSEIAWYPVGEYISINTATCGDGEQPNYTESPISHIKHVHQLQNLYFALTGEELQIKQ